MELLNPLISEYTWANKPSVAPLGQIICVTDIGENGILCRGNGTKWVRMHPTTVSSLGSSVVLTGTTAETTLLTIPIKGGLMGLGGRLNVLSFYAFTNNANSKTVRAKVGATVVASMVSTNQSTSGFNFWMLNINSETSQRTITSAGISVDTSVDFTLTLTGQLANSADSLTVFAQTLEVI